MYYTYDAGDQIVEDKLFIMRLTCDCFWFDFVVNDPFVLNSWAKTFPENKHVKFLADGSAKYTHALGLELDLSDKGLGIRSKRFALLVEDLKVKVANVEEGGEYTISGAEEIIKALWAFNECFESFVSRTS